MKNFKIQIRYHGYYASFNVTCEDSALGIEKSILDKLGEKSIKWENLGKSYRDQRRITYEEVIDDTRPIHYEEVLGVRVATGAPEGGQV